VGELASDFSIRRVRFGSLSGRDHPPVIMLTSELSEIPEGRTMPVGEAANPT